MKILFYLKRTKKVLKSMMGSNTFLIPLFLLIKIQNDIPKNLVAKEK